MFSKLFDVIVVGGGHAGTEAASASARIGCKTILLTDNIDSIGQLSCNPSIGGIGKSQLVREIDALGGLMAIASDHSGIQFRVLNRKKGPAVHSIRAQVDRILYSNSIKNLLKTQKNLIIFQAKIESLVLKNNQVLGVKTKIGLTFQAKSVVLTVGTFLGGKIHIGSKSFDGGRAGDSSSINLSCNLRELPLRVNRLKTGTPPRISSKSINFSSLIIQSSDVPIPVFSFIGSKDQHPKQLPCYITNTNENTHKIILENLKYSPIYSGIIKGTGPRYCPSIEDKVVRFKDRISHQIFLEPEGINSDEIYPNGISTSLPFDVQAKIIRSIHGLEYANITRPGYAIEYDFFDPKDLKLTLESNFIKGLFLAGQINGTTGYEEAGAQGLIAGLNAARLASGQEGWYPRRDQAYIGVLIDDLCTLGTQEPYRMFTSRAEYRLSLRQDNADFRLTEIGYKLGLVDQKRWKKFSLKVELIEKEYQKLRNTWIVPNSFSSRSLNKLLQTPILKKINGEDLLRRPEISYACLSSLQEFSKLDNSFQFVNQIEAELKYDGYVVRQKKEIEKKMYNELMKLPENLNYKNVVGLSNEVISKLNDCKPSFVGQASRIPGITPSAISVLLIWLKKRGFLKS